MIVDDSQAVRLAVKRILIGAGYDVVVACDGEEAVAKLSERPALVVLDINMPGLDGYGFCEQMDAEDSPFESVPVVFLTSEKSRALELLGNQFGAYLQKPVKPEELLRVVEEQLLAEAR